MRGLRSLNSLSGFVSSASPRDSIAAIMGAGGLDYAYFDFTQTSRLFQDVAGTIPADNIGEPIGLVQAPLNRPVHSAVQAGASQRPALQLTGAKFDSTDDRLAADWKAQLGANCIIAYGTIPAAIGAGAQMLAGATGPTGTFAFQLGVNTAGNTVGGFGSQSFTTIFGTDNVLNREVVIGLSVSTTTVKLFSEGSEVYSAARAGDPNTAHDVMIGARSIDGAAQNFFGGSIKKILFGKVAPTLAQFQAISAQMRAS